MSRRPNSFLGMDDVRRACATLASCWRHGAGSLVLLLAAATSAQELRRSEVPEYSHACYDPFRQRVIVVGNGNYSREWDGVSWQRTPDLGARPGFMYVDAAARVLSLRSAYGQSTGYSFEPAARVGMQWQSIPPGGPMNRRDIALAYARSTNRVLAFGGAINGGPQLSNVTWSFDGSTWTFLAPSTFPTARRQASMTFDEGRQRFVLFGGIAVAFSGTQLVNDTWEWDGTTWSQVVTASAPPPRRLARMTYDSARQRVVLVGGADGGVGAFSDLWEYDGTQWQSFGALPITFVHPDRGGALVYDAARNETLALGGHDATGATGAVMAWNGSAWSSRPGLPSGPKFVWGPAIATEANGSDVLHFGGSEPFAGNWWTNELWRWDGSTWSLLSNTGPARHGAMLWSQQGSTFRFGGFTIPASGTATNDIWRWNGTVWSQVAAAGPSARGRAAIAVDAAGNRALMFGGLNFSTMGETWSFDGAAWLQHTATPQPPTRHDAAMAFDPLRNRFVLVGGTSNGNPRQDVWEFDGTAWQQVTGASAPPAAFWVSQLGSIAFDSAVGGVVCFRRIPSLTSPTSVKAWRYDGVAWTELAALGTTTNVPLVVGERMFAYTTASGRAAFFDDYFGITELLAQPTATFPIGAPCSPASPVIATTGLATPGNASFAVELTRMLANGVGAIAAGDQPASVPVLGCTLWTAPLLAVFGVAASPTGHARLPLPLPSTPGLLGLTVCFQGASLDASSPSGLWLGAGLRVRLGE